MKTLYVQTDTTGQFLFREPVTNPDQPHLARLAWVIGDGNRVLGEQCMLIKPADGVEWEPGAVIASGIPPERARRDGVPLIRAMAVLMSTLDGVGRVCAFNADFHVKVLQRSAAELGLNWQHLFVGKHIACAMRNSTELVQKPRMAPGGGYAWPKLGEAYRFFSGKEPPSMDMDTIERGLALARCVRVIDCETALQKGLTDE